MMKQYLISSVFSLSLVSLAQAAELSVEEQCLSLGYDTKISDCEAAGSAALVCPVNNGNSDMAICITDSCRGYPLFKKSGKFYYHDQAGNEIEAVPSKGQLTDYVDGAFEICTAGYGNNAVTYYRVPKCKGKALYNGYFCDVGCDTEKKYPYTYHPGNTAGIVQKCVTADQTYYGYSSCNKGWIGGWSSSGGVGRCGLDDCNMIDYPYSVEPNVSYYGENRGKTDTCKIGGSVYYRYTECNGDNFVLKGVNTSDRKGTVCARKCEVINCSKEAFEYQSNGELNVTLNDWACKLDNAQCREGDIVTYKGTDVGIIIATEYEVSVGRVRKLMIPINYAVQTKTFSETGAAATADIPYLQNGNSSSWGKAQTRRILIYGEETGYKYPAAEYCAREYAPACGNDSFCSVGEWYLPSLNELGKIWKIIETKYPIQNVFGNRNNWPSTNYVSSSENSSQFAAAYGTYTNKFNSFWVLPMLAF